MGVHILHSSWYALRENFSSKTLREFARSFEVPYLNVTVISSMKYTMVNRRQINKMLSSR